MTKKQAPRSILPDSKRAAPTRAKRLAAKVSPDERIEVTIRVRRRADTPQQVATGAALTRDEFRATYGAHPDDIAKVEAFANEHGLDVVQTSVSQRAVRLSGTAEAMRRAFAVRLQSYQAIGSKARFRGRTGTISVPSTIADIVEGVFGLDNRPQARPHFHIVPPQRGVRARASDGAKPLSPLEVAKLYNFPTNRDGSGQCIAIIELGGGFRPADLTAYFKKLGIKSPSVSAISVNGAHNDPNGPSKDANGEVMLDIEVAGAVAPAARIAVYFAPNTDAGFLGALTTAIHDTVRNPSVVSISWGAPESEWTMQAMQDFDSACHDATLMGINVTVAAGDHGAPDTDDPQEKRAHADFPSSSPNVIACGGTRLVGPTTITSETVWNTHDGWATGGGISDVFPLPAYQGKAGVPPSRNADHRVGRGVPDVSGNADSDTGYIVRVDGQTVTIGGTSAVAPLWAGLIALLNQGRPRFVGFLNPILYALPQTTKALRDITQGDNGVNAVPGYASATGWDACTGLGSPHGQNLLKAL